MASNDLKESFLLAADAWLCDGYSLDIRYIAATNASSISVRSAIVQFSPLPPQVDRRFDLSAGIFFVGQDQQVGLPKTSLFEALTSALDGSIVLSNKSLKLLSDGPISYESDASDRDKWFNQLQLTALGQQIAIADGYQLAAADNTLRMSTPAFDGLVDVASWMGLLDPGNDQFPPHIHVRVSPPVDLVFDRCKLSNDNIDLTLEAHPNFDTSKVSLAVRTLTEPWRESRKQVGSKLSWSMVGDRQLGNVSIKLPVTDNVLVMLLIEGTLVRRQYLVDSARARNTRMAIVQHFDNELRMVRDATFSSSDSRRFELGIAQLAFIHGFTPAVQVETDAPDLILATPVGRTVVVECTTRVADISAKVGKLVDRRNSLVKHLRSSGHWAEVLAVLVCRQPRDQLSVRKADLAAQGVVLMTQEDIESAFNLTRVPKNPDDLFLSSAAELEERSTSTPR